MNDVIFNSASLVDWIRCISLEKLVPNPDSHYDPMTSKTPRWHSWLKTKDNQHPSQYYWLVFSLLFTSPHSLFDLVIMSFSHPLIPHVIRHNTQLMLDSVTTLHWINYSLRLKAVILTINIFLWWQCWCHYM